MSYDQQILQVLYNVGQRGISVRLLAKHIYNLNCTLFSQPDLTDVHRYVSQYLRRHARGRQPLVERTERRGCYRLNTLHSSYAQQLALQFSNANSATGDETPGDTTPPVQEDHSLSLFD